VLTPLWQKNGFWALVTVALIAATILLMRLRNQRVALANERLQEVVAQRTSSLEASNRQLAYQATYDELTGLFNRRSFQERLSRTWAEKSDRESPSYLMYLDLDQFKIVNDTCGHAAGDQLLRQISTQIHSKIRKDDALGRPGGD